MYTHALNMCSMSASVVRGVYNLGELMPDALLMLMYANGCCGDDPNQLSLTTPATDALRDNSPAEATAQRDGIG